MTDRGRPFAPIHCGARFWITIFREARGGGLTFEGDGERGRAAARACGLPMDPCLVYREWFAAAGGDAGVMTGLGSSGGAGCR